MKLNELDAGGDTAGVHSKPPEEKELGGGMHL